MTRSYARVEHYDPASKRRNLHLLTGTTVTKILFQGKTATGVQVSIAGYEAGYYTYLSLVQLIQGRATQIRQSQIGSDSRRRFTAHTTSLIAFWNR
jgi:choline dehydrogenase-like flavoprotein